VKEETDMARIAVVTGGTRGLSRAISLALRDAGHRVAAVYLRDVDAARRFSDETAIPAYKWNVADFQACHYGLLQAERDLGPVDILINNAGIIEDACCTA
jgi:acetoacetyl-CoA reductase